MKAQKFTPLLIVAAGLLAYHNSFTGPFIFDDTPSIQENQTIRHLWPIWQALSPPTLAGVGGRPVVNFTLAINYAFGGMSVQGYHALNVAIHILAGLILLGVVRRTLLQPTLRERFGFMANGLALAAALLWIVHPLQTEAVTYVSQRAESLMGLFYLLTLYCFIRGTASPKAGWWFVASVAVCLLGMGTKEVMVTAPLMVLLYDRTFVAGSFRTAWTQRRRLYLGLAGTWLVLGYLMVGVHHRGVGYGLGVTWQAYAMTECRSVVNYLWLAIWPHPLVFDYGANAVLRHVADAVPYALILLLLVSGVLIGLRRWPAIGFVGAWFFAILAPTSSVVPIVQQPMAESRMYLPLAAVIVLGMLAIRTLIGRRTVVVMMALAIGLGFLTARRNADYRSEVSIWSDTVAKRPDNARAHNHLGNALLRMGRLSEAIGQYDQALRLRPNFAETHNNYGNALVQQGRLPEAMGQYEQALRIEPAYPEAHNNMGFLLAQGGKIPEAIERYERALRAKPDYSEAHFNLGNALFASGSLKEAIEHYEQALRTKPDYIEAQCNLGNALLASGRLNEAIEHYERALQIKPDYVAAHCNLGVAFEQAGRIQDAIAQYEQVLGITPNFAEAQRQLARLRAVR